MSLPDNNSCTLALTPLDSAIRTLEYLFRHDHVQEQAIFRHPWIYLGWRRILRRNLDLLLGESEVEGRSITGYEGPDEFLPNWEPCWSGLRTNAADTAVLNDIIPARWCKRSGKAKISYWSLAISDVREVVGLASLLFDHVRLDEVLPLLLSKGGTNIETDRLVNLVTQIDLWKRALCLHDGRGEQRKCRKEGSTEGQHRVRKQGPRSAGSWKRWLAGSAPTWRRPT